MILIKLQNSFIEITLDQVTSLVNLLHISRITFHKNTSRGLLLIILTRHFANFVSKFYSDIIFGLLQHDFLHLYTLKYKESVMLNLNFLFREPKLYSQPGQRVLLAMIKVESENECRFQNMPYD